MTGQAVHTRFIEERKFCTYKLRVETLNVEYQSPTTSQDSLMQECCPLVGFTAVLKRRLGIMPLSHRRQALAFIFSGHCPTVEV